MGELLVRVTRLSVLLIIATGAPLLLYGYGALRLWMGQSFAASSVAILHVLVLANMVRLIGLPYSAMVVGTGKQWLASWAPVCEAAINFIASIVLAKHVGAIGVAYGTLIGSFVSIAVIFTVCLRKTRNTLKVDSRALTVNGLLRPGVAIVPMLVFLPYWWTNHAPRLSGAMYGLVDLMTMVLLLVGLDINKRNIREFSNFVLRRPVDLGAL
jgi:O-antigen/teichoic acid export membrane protein